MATRAKRNKPKPFVVEVLNLEGFKHFWNDVEISEETYQKNVKEHEEWVKRFEEEKLQKTLESTTKRKKK